LYYYSLYVCFFIIKEQIKKEVKQDFGYMDRIDSIVAPAKNTAIGAPVIEFGLMKEVDVELRDGMTAAGYYSEGLFGNPTIYLNADLDDKALTVALVHELRHVEQIMVSKRPIEMTPLDAIKLTRIFEADASAYRVSFAAEIYAKSVDKKYLSALEEWEDDDIRDIFLKTLVAKNNIQDIPAFAAAFKQWFNKRERVDHYDKSAIEGFIAFHESPWAKISLAFNESAQSINKETLRDVGRIFTGESYLDETNIKDDLLTSDFYIGNISPSVLRQIALGS
jgi:hypothetical protein